MPIDSEHYLTKEWSQVASELSLSIAVQVKVELSPKLVITSPVLVKDFGAKFGMLLFESYDDVQEIKNDLLAQGYGYSVLPPDPYARKFDIESYKRVLCDWGWSGPPELRPHWCVELEDEDD